MTRIFVILFVLTVNTNGAVDTFVPDKLCLDEKYAVVVLFLSFKSHL